MVHEHALPDEFARRPWPATSRASNRRIWRQSATRLTTRSDDHRRHARDPSAINSAFAHLLSRVTYLVKDALTCPRVGQLIQRALPTAVANSTFNIRARGFVFTSEPAAYSSLKIRFVQPDTAVRAR